MTGSRSRHWFPTGELSKTYAGHDVRKHVNMVVVLVVVNESM